MKRIVSLILAVMLCAGLAAPAMAAGTSFTDVPSSHWAYAEIQSAVSDGITTGYSDGTFKPTASVTYAHFAAFLARAFYPSEIDLTITPWYKPYTDVLAAHGILDNTLIDSDLAANINQPINRYEMAKMMYNIIRSKGMTIPDNAITIADAGLNDLMSMPVYYRIPVAACYALGVLNGQSDGNFGGQNLMNRAQGCVVICRLRDKIENGSAVTTPVTPTKPAETTSNIDAITGTGKLSNGKPITVDNVLELIDELRVKYPDNSIYMPVGTRYSSHALPGQSSHAGCNGLATMFSDYIFGTGLANPPHLQTDYTKIRPGDIIIERHADDPYDDFGTKSNKWLYHVTMATSEYSLRNDYEEGEFSVVQSNHDHDVIWEKASDQSNMGNNHIIAEMNDVRWSVWTRYPD